MRLDGATVCDLRYADVDPRWFGLGLHRGVLFVTLYDAVRREPGVTVRLGVAIAGLARDREGVTVLGDGGALGRHDLIVAADGSVSELHATAGVPVRTRAYPWGALWFVADDPASTFTGELRQVVTGARRMIFLGDAAHATSPQLGNGANLALMDAMVLADTLAEADALEPGLAAYSQARRHHLRHDQFMSNVLTPFFQSSSRALGWIRDRFMPIADRIGPFHRIMVRTMAGHECGLFLRHPLALPPPPT